MTGTETEIRAKNAAYMREYRKANPAPKNPRKLRPCGTRSAYARHIRNGETPCDACRAGNTSYYADRRTTVDGL